jgi:subtilisin family serine protease
MKHYIKYLFAFLAISLIVVSCSKNPTDPSEFGNKTSIYIVVFNQDGNSIQSRNINPKIQEIFAKHNIDISELIYTYDVVLNGFAANLTEAQAKALQADKSIKYIEKDQIVTINDPVISIDNNKSNKIQVNQPVPWGIAYVGGPKVNTDAGVAWVVDTGIDFTHPDLNINTSLSKTFVARTKSADDDHGHGSHCAGIIAAKDNTIGVVGVCPGATIIAVKVLNRQGSGSYSDIIAGLNYVGQKRDANKVNVVNMSLGGPVYTALDDAVRALAAKGVYIVIAAGNSAADANNYSPARVEATGVFTISAHDNIGKFASFSNFANPPIEFAAPGVLIYSCYKDGNYATMSGTSMAAPHVAGIILANGGSSFTSNGTVTGDKDDNPDPIVHL